MDGDDDYGSILIHASGNLAPRAALARPAIARALKRFASTMCMTSHAQQSLGVVDIHGIVFGNDRKAVAKIAEKDKAFFGSRNFRGSYLWRLTNSALVPPIHCDGHLGLWRVPADITKKLPRKL